MTTETTNYLIRCDKTTAEFLSAEIKNITGAVPRQSDIKGIGGEAEIIVFGAAALELITAIIELVTASIEARHTIKSIKVGDQEVFSPSASDMSKLKPKTEESGQ